MKKFITVLIGCSLTLAAGVRAEQENPKKKPSQKSKPAQAQQAAPKQQAGPKQGPAANPHPQNGGQPQHKAPAVQNNARVQNNVPREQAQTMPAVQKNKMHKGPNVQSNQMNQAPIVEKNKQLKGQGRNVQPHEMNQAPVVEKNKQLKGQGPNVPANQPNQQAAAQLNKKNVKTFQRQHQDFHAQPKSSIASTQFNQNYRIAAAQNWNGAQYNVYRSYQSQWHDQDWWRSHHSHLSLIGGGWYFWDAGYWYPAWGYDPGVAYYPYDGPVYVGQNAAPLDQVIADVQSALQEMGYYHGEVDGLLGPLTREALAAYQRDQGLYATSTIDQPTLESLGLS